MMSKFNLTPVADFTAPVVIYGMYNMDDYSFFETFEPFKIILWRGTDAKIMNSERARRILAGRNYRNIAASKTVQKSLAAFNIESEVMPITSTPLNIPLAKRGKYVYCYVCSTSPIMHKRYQFDRLKKLEHALKIKFLYINQNSYKFKKLLNIYRQCCIGIRLLDHDGLSNSIIEMGLMGRRTISNSGLPHTIPWKTMKDVKNAIVREYKRRLEDNSQIRADYLKLIDIGDKWLEI
jgi:hypothetical protein